MKTKYILLFCISIVIFQNAWGQNIIKETTEYFESASILKSRFIYEYKYDENDLRTEIIHSKLDLISKEEVNYSKGIYSYNAAGQQIEAINFLFDTLTNEYRQRTKKVFDYDGGELIRERRFFWADEEWDLKNDIEFELDSDGCPIYQSMDQYSLGGGITTRIAIIENNFNCTEPWREPLEYYFGFKSFDEIRKLVRTRSGNVELEEWYRCYDTEDCPDLWATIERTYDEAGNLLLVIDGFRDWDIGREVKQVFTYDEETGDQLSSEYFSRPDGTTVWKQEYQTFYEYTYENDLLVERKTTGHIYENGIKTTTIRSLNEYEYCDSGLLQRKIYKSLDDDYVYTIVTYEYDESSSCLPYYILDQCTSELDFLIFPNPAQQYIAIKSDLLNAPDAVVRIFSVDGKLLLEQKPKNGFMSPVISVKNFGQQLLLVFVEGNGKKESGKVMKME